MFLDIGNVSNIPGGIIDEASPATDRRRFAQRAQDSNRVPGNTGLVVDRDGASLAAQSSKDEMWFDEAIDPTRWDKSFPYQLLVLDVDKGRYSSDGLWEFTLPIPPEALTISTPPAVTLSVTQHGIVEEHNGAPIKNIQVRGTTGVLPNRGTAASGGDPISNAVGNAVLGVGGVFGGTVDQISQLVTTSAARLGFARTNLEDQLSLDLGTPGNIGRGTGYYQFHLLRLFFEGYLAMKKRPEGRTKRLALAIWKDRAVYIVSPHGPFELQRNAEKPLEYAYSFSFKAWRRVQIDGYGAAAAESFQGSDFTAGLAAQVLGALLNARNVLEGARDVMEAVRTDTQKLFEPLRQTVLLLKNATGTAITLADLPASIAADAGGPGGQALAQVANSIGNQARVDAHTAGTKSQGSIIAAEAQGDRQQQTATQTAALFANSRQEFATMNTIEAQSLQLRPATRQRIQEEIERVKKLTRLDFEQFRDDVQAFAADYADSCGAGDATYNATYGRATRTATKSAADFDWQILFALNQTAIEMSRMAISSPQATGRPHALEMVAGLARASNIAFRIPLSKIAVPVPYHATIEQISSLYLGDPNRWIEISALNALRAPYIDEEGFYVPLIANGILSQVVVASAENLRPGQAVTLTANNTPPTKRRITSIDVVHSSMAVVQLDGLQDLARFTTMAGAQIHTYLPDTLNSQQLVYIPSAIPVSESLSNKPIPGVSPADIARGGVDLLLRTNGDAAIGPGGAWPFAVGVTNLIQRTRVAFQTRRGTLPQHPSFGLGLRPGESTSELNAKGILAAARGMFAGDPDFAGISAVRVLQKGNAMRVGLSINVAGTDLPLPVSLAVRR